MVDIVRKRPARAQRPGRSPQWSGESPRAILQVEAPYRQIAYLRYMAKRDGVTMAALWAPIIDAVIRIDMGRRGNL